MCVILTRCCSLANRCKLHFWRQITNDVSELPVPFPHSHSPSRYSRFLIPFPHFRPLMLPLTCTTSTVCPLPETLVQLSMVTRSVYRQMLPDPTALCGERQLKRELLMLSQPVPSAAL